MKYFIDTEFIEYPCTIDLISIALVAEDGREFYAISSEFDESKASQWVKKNVIKQLEPSIKRQSKKVIATKIKEFIGKDYSPEFWGYFCSYDWVVFMWLFGTMIDKPSNFPYYCKDIKQVIDGFCYDPPAQKEGNHNALHDARWVKTAYETYY